MPDGLPPDLALMAAAFPDAESPWSLYRQTYNATDCGPSLGLKVYTEGHAPTPNDPMRSAGQSDWLWCEDLGKLGTSWAEVERNSYEIKAIAVSSIVEGIEATADTIEIALDGHTPETLATAFNSALANVDLQVDQLWNATHGCDACKRHFGKSEDDLSPVWSDCPDCGGDGVAI